MNFALPPLASIEAVRPVFMIVMGLSLVITAWRLSRSTTGWTARMIVSGAFLLGLGYAVILPLYEAGIIEPLSRQGHYHGLAADAIAFHVVKVITMNSGWLLFGLGLAMHAQVFTPSKSRRKGIALPNLTTHESVA
jgi:riboflavin transporter FmnP